MADPTNPNEPTGNANSGGEAQQALDDLTVLQNVQDQSMGDARLNVARPTDVSDGALGGLANVQQGSTSNPQVHDVGGIVGGVNLGLDVAIEGGQKGSSAPPILDSTPVDVNDTGAQLNVPAAGAAPPNVQALTDLAKPEGEVKPQDSGAGAPVLGAAPAGFVPGNTVGAAPAADVPKTDAAPQTLDQHVNHAPTMTAEVASQEEMYQAAKSGVEIEDAKADTEVAPETAEGKKKEKAWA